MVWYKERTVFFVDFLEPFNIITGGAGLRIHESLVKLSRMCEGEMCEERGIV